MERRSAAGTVFHDRGGLSGIRIQLRVSFWVFGLGKMCQRRSFSSWTTDLVIGVFFMEISVRKVPFGLEGAVLFLWGALYD